MDKIYDHNLTESKWYSFWEKNKYFTPKIDKKKTPFTIIMPPPNANGELHIGHATFIVVEDILIRYHRMKGDPTLWLPGADHAGILTQVVYERELNKQGKSRFDLGRNEFFKQTYDFTMKNKKHMNSQLRALGASCDWTREKFTLDSEISKAVFTTFKNLYDEGLIYKGERIINWCPRCGTALSDLEVEHKEKKGKLWFIKYPIKEGGTITVATTRPETMLGDTAVAVNPTDDRYQERVGKTVILPIMNREIPILADDLVAKDFGTGAVKVTPAHDQTDFEIGKKHNLESISVIGLGGKMSSAAGHFSGQGISETREKIVNQLKGLSLIERVEDHNYSLGICERCRNIVQPLLSKQWFLKIATLAKPAIEVVRKGEIKIHPKRFEKVYYNWMENIHDWCISRQIWWGHQIPVYYCSETKNAVCKKSEGQFVSVEKPSKCPHCNSTKFEQETDTLDTWFSSGQWPYTTLGWPKETPDFEYFYPSSVMETGYDILFFWVARMIMFGLYSTGKPPFHTVFLHGLVRDEHGRKMSKSKGNVIDPLEISHKYGADTVRMALVFGTSSGADINLGESKIKGMRNFTNKLWNIGRFVIDMAPEKSTRAVETEEDQWIKEELKKTKVEVTKAIEGYRFGQAAEEVYDFVWKKFAAKYIEYSKDRREEAQPVLEEVLEESLRLLHPFMPFITEELWQKLPTKKGESIMVSPWPN